MPRLLLIVCAALAAVTFLPVPAHAAGWLAPVTLQPSSSAPSGTSGAKTASNAGGAQAVTWNNNMSNSDGGDVCLSGELVSRSSGGAWSAPTVIGCEAVLGVGPSDEVVAVWVNSSKLYVATGTAGQPLGSPVQIDSNPYNMWYPIVRFSPSGRPTVVWAAETVGVSDSAYQLRTITRNTDGTWPGAPTVAVTGASLTQPMPDLAFGPSGEAVIAYNKSSNVTGKSIQVLYRGPSATNWNAEGALGPVTIFNFDAGPRVLFDPQGRATVMEAIMTAGSPTAATSLNTWLRGAAGGWSATQAIPNSSAASAGQIVPKGDFAIDSAGNAVAVWMHGTSSSVNVRVATRAAGGTTWSTGLVTLLGANLAGQPSVPDAAFDSAGNATVAFSYAGKLYLFSSPAGSGSFATQALPPGAIGSNPVMATDANGYLIATWTDASGATSTSVYDPVAPVIDSLEVPADGVAGRPVAFNVNGSDVWGPVTYSVDFGDGAPAATGRVIRRVAGGVLARATATGAVQHTYAQPGTYNAVVTLTDGAANTSSTSRTVTVAQAPTAPIPPVAGLPAPVLGTTVNLETVRPVVRVREPGSRTFVPLTSPRQVRMGSIVDTRKGRVRMTISDGRGKLHTAEFYEGMFKVVQRKKPGSVAALHLFGGSFKGCPRAPRKPARFSARRLSKKRSVRHLWGAGSGSFRTVGRYSSATLRGTTWLTDDRCNGTVTRVTQGRVAVRDFVRRRTIVLRAPKRYLAQPRATRSR